MGTLGAKYIYIYIYIYIFFFFTLEIIQTTQKVQESWLSSPASTENT
ncbi:hypothetical protein G4228_018383 [Cervus hanglu yarkandensis]|nr:hypothetical protein G4228_018383 [Cervus hanglu yarkandensis]